MFRNECTVTPEDALFYRHVIVFTPFAATTLGLAAICLIALWDYYQKRRMLQLVTLGDHGGDIQIRKCSVPTH